MEFILNETHFSGSDVVNCIQIFNNNVDESRTRYNELISLNCRPDRLRILALARKQYIEHIRRHCEISNTKKNWDQFSVIEKRIKEKKYN